MSSFLQHALLKGSEETKDKLLIKLLDSLICSVCHDYMFVPVMTQCGHNYCYDCLTSWFESNNNELSCPQCRASISETPGLNSVLQQWLGLLMDSLEEKDGKGFQELLHSKESNEKSYKFDKNNDTLFNGIFKTSAIGVVDEDDDGILRCSNCHWELEDDVGDICPHCNSRIRSRMPQSRHGANEEEDEDDYSEEDDEELVDELKLSLERYHSEVRRNVARLRGSQDITNTGFLVKDETEGGTPFYISSYSLYVGNDWTLHDAERGRRARLVQNLEGGSASWTYNSADPASDHYEDGYEGTDISDDLDAPDEESLDDEEDQPGYDDHAGVVDLEAEVEDNSEEESRDSGHDSDFYEQNDEGFVSGDSLDDEPVEEEPEQSDDLEVHADESQESSDESQRQRNSGTPSSRKRKRFQVVIDSDEDES